MKGFSKAQIKRAQGMLPKGAQIVSVKPSDVERPGNRVNDRKSAEIIYNYKGETWRTVVSANFGWTCR